MKRTAEGVYQGPAPHWVGDGFRVSNYFPGGNPLAAKVSPFFFLDYHAPHAYPPTTSLRRGVGPHPHRGLETVTVALEGSVAHHDSTGMSGVIGPGDVQWMTAGGGILHKEYHAEAFARAGGTLHMLQFWVNLPKADKLTPPRYQGITAAQIPVVELAGGGGRVRIIAGSYQGTRGAAETFGAVTLLDVRLAAGASADFHAPFQENVAGLVVKGSVSIAGTAIKTGELVLLNHDANDYTVTATANAQLFLFGGQPIAETIVSAGPFVMNTREEILQAFADFEAGKFGTLED